jgi:serine/threonine-protein kinase
MAQENLTGRTVAGYRLLERIGEGGTATVYRAEHPERGLCAIKILRERMRNDPTAVKRFLREAGYGTRVKHPSVVGTYDYGELDSLYYLALEWAEGEPLSDFVHRTGRLAPDLVVHLITQLAGGLSVAHAEGIVHRDLKPENIIYNPETRELKLLDFGIARDAQLDAADRLTRTGFFVGTLNYVAPEALSGELVDEAADMQLLTQDPMPLNEAVHAVRFPAVLERTIMTALARDPKQRQPSVDVFAQERRAALEAEAHEPPVPEPSAEGGFLGKMRSMFKGKQT